jgi:FKBP-type peptidyl-prolyl cis-trans isomerase FklB
MRTSLILIVTTIVFAGICWADDALKIQDHNKKILASQNEHVQTISQKNLMKGKAFLTENSKKENVVTLPSGMQYQILREGKGEPPKPNDTVTVHYRGMLINGKEFDSSYDRGEPATFQVNGVIRGWQEGLQLMRPGAEYKLFVPPELAYGERGTGRKIGPNSTLIFDVKLLSIRGRKQYAPPKAEGIWPNDF